MVFLVPFKRIVGLCRFVFPSFPPRAKKDRENNRFYRQQTMRTGREKSSSRFLTGHFLSSPLNYDSTCTKMPRRIREIARRLETPYCEIIRSLPAPSGRNARGLVNKNETPSRGGRSTPPLRREFSRPETDACFREEQQTHNRPIIETRG